MGQRACVAIFSEKRPYLVIFRCLHALFHHDPRIQDFLKHVRKQRSAHVVFDEHQTIGRDCLNDQPGHVVQAWAGAHQKYGL
jgi:hypothetical protein